MIVEPGVGGDGIVEGRNARDFHDDGTVRDDSASVCFFYLITNECCV